MRSLAPALVALFVVACGASRHVTGEPFVELLESTPVLVPGALHVSLRAILPRGEPGEDCTLGIAWTGRAGGTTDAITPSAIGMDGSVRFETVVALPLDEDLVEVEGSIECPTRSRRVLPRRVGTEATLARYCSMCAGVVHPAAALEAREGDAELGIGVHPGIAARVRDGRLVDACDERVLVDVSAITGAGLVPQLGLVEHERSLLYEHEHGEDVCGRSLAAGALRLPPEAVAEVLRQLRAAPGIADVRRPVEPY